MYCGYRALWKCRWTFCFCEARWLIFSPKNMTQSGFYL
jgi:hypothetical protein